MQRNKGDGGSTASTACLPLLPYTPHRLSVFRSTHLPRCRRGSSSPWLSTYGEARNVALQHWQQHGSSGGRLSSSDGWHDNITATRRRASTNAHKHVCCHCRRLEELQPAAVQHMQPHASALSHPLTTNGLHLFLRITSRRVFLTRKKQQVPPPHARLCV